MLISVVKMATVLEEYVTKGQRSDVPLYDRKLNARDIHKEMFPVYVAKCYRIKLFTSGW
jgi:hypothetical protein